LIFMLDPISLTPIGTVHNKIHQRPETWKETVSKIVVKEEVQDALDGLDQFSHIVVIFYLHLSVGSVLKVHPRGDTTIPLTGVFATRAPVRPTPVGVSVVELVNIHKNVVTVKGLDCLDGTPVLDIKPHLPLVSPTKVPDWVHR
jgi:tRNA-Thr(GGU) m(6)t(6)A37 methyltransferase TsaA